jgi:hypothetical protein
LKDILQKIYYLNRNLIASRKINLKEIRKLFPNYDRVRRRTGSYESSELFDLAGDEISASMKIRNSIHKSNLGDVTISLMPGWLEFDEKYGFTSESSAIISRTPFFMFGWKIKPLL